MLAFEVSTVALVNAARLQVQYRDISPAIAVPLGQSPFIRCPRAVLQILDRRCVLDQRRFRPGCVHESQAERHAR